MSNLLLTVGCGRSEVDDIAPTEDGALLNITISGIDEDIAVSMTTRSVEQLADYTEPQSAINERTGGKLVSLENTDVFISAKLVTDENTTISSTEDANASTNTMARSVTPEAATSAMTNGVRYRLIVYNQDNALVVNQVATAGTNPQIRVDGHRDYTWYALSLNETAQVPDMNTSGSVAKAGLTNKDVLYASGTISTVDGNNYLNIVFRRMTSRFRVKLDVRGLFGTITGNTSLSLLKNASNTGLVTMGDFNVRTGAFSSIERYPNTVVVNTQMLNVEGTPSATTKYANFYTLDTEAITANNLKVRLNRLDITLDDATTRSFTTASTVTYANPYTPTIGTTYELSLGMVEQPIRIHGILWARTNLVYASTNTDRYRLKPNNNAPTSTNRDTEYWNWMSSTPSGATASTDPCSLVYPAGTWRMPTLQEWQSLGDPDSRGFTYVWNLDSDYAVNAAYTDNNLLIPFGGYRTTDNSVTGTPSSSWLGLTSSGQCHYWTATSQSNTLAYAFESSYSTVVGFPWGGVIYSIKNKSEGRNIRCVR